MHSVYKLEYIEKLACRAIIIMKYLRFLSLFLVLFVYQSAIAAKLVITTHDKYVDTETPFFDSQGNKVFLDQYEGSTVLLVFWATWCGSCISEMPSLDNLQKDFRKLPFKVIAVSQDYQGLKVINKHFTENEIRHLEIFHDYQNKLFRALSIVGMPTAMLINADGKMKINFKGPVKWHDDKIRAMILTEMEGNLVTPKNTYKVVSLNKRVSKRITTPEKNNVKQNKGKKNEIKVN